MSMTVRPTSLLLVVASALAMTACETSATQGQDRLAAWDWTAVSIDGKPVVQKGRVTLSIADGRVSGRGGCNRYSGTVDYDRSTLTIGPLISTKMACPENGLMVLETAYLGALQTARSYRFADDGALTINTASGAIAYEASARQVTP